MKTSLVVLMVATLLVGTAIVASADERAWKEAHRGTGIVIALSPSEITPDSLGGDRVPQLSEEGHT